MSDFVMPFHGNSIPPLDTDAPKTLDSGWRWMKHLIRNLTPELMLLSILLFPFESRGLEVSPKKECALCHVMWVSDFQSPEETIIPFQGGNVLMKDTMGVVSSEEVCFSCHDGFVRDSRRRLSRGYSHPVYVKPGKEYASIPPDLPLSVKSEIYCGTCHSIHSLSSKESPEFRLFLRRDNTDSGLCSACHRDYFGNGNHPVMTGRGNFRIPKGFGRTGSGGKVICETCHTSHGASHRRLLLQDPDSAGFCSPCHEGMRGGGFGHREGMEIDDRLSGIITRFGGKIGPRGEFLCQSCHSPHRSALENLLKVDIKDDTCISCHMDKRGIRGGPHNIPERFSSLHPELRAVVKKGECRSCHKSHGWNIPLPEGGSISDLCLACHRKEPPFTEGEGRHHPLKISLDIEGGKEKRMECLTCHDPHEGERGHLLNLEPLELCLECHSDKIGILATPHSFEEKGCAGCHLSHGGSVAGFPLGARPKEGIDPISSTCLTCHSEDEKGFLESHGSHPVGISFSIPSPALIKGPLPLFNEKGERTLSGYISCSTCHDPHGAGRVLSPTGPPEHIRFLFRKYPDKAGICSPCHEKEKGVVESPHNLTAGASGAGEGGKRQEWVCNVCHTAHPLPGGSAKVVKGDGLCLACHGKTSPERYKRVKFTEHPGNPIFLKKGGPAEGIFCTTCHEPHSPTPSQGGTLKKFLKHREEVLRICSQCHGEEALYLYTYFHRRGAGRRGIR